LVSVQDRKTNSIIWSQPEQHITIYATKFHFSVFFVVFVVFFPYHGCARMVNRQSLNSPACSVSHYGSAHIAHAHPLDHMISTYRTCSSLRSATSRGNAHSVTVTHMANYRHTGPSDRRHITRNTKNIAPTQTSTLHSQVLPNIYRILH
jgi:hypothetical protein